MQTLTVPHMVKLILSVIRYIYEKDRIILLYASDDRGEFEVRRLRKRGDINRTSNVGVSTREIAKFIQ